MKAKLKKSIKFLQLVKAVKIMSLTLKPYYNFKIFIENSICHLLSPDLRFLSVFYIKTFTQRKCFEKKVAPHSNLKNFLS